MVNDIKDDKKRINKSSKRTNLLHDVTADVKFHRVRNVYMGAKRNVRGQKGPKPTIKSIEVSSPKLIGNFSTDIYGRNLVMDGCEGIRVYNLPVERLERIQNIASENDDVVDDWEQLVDKVTKCDISSTPLSSTEITIPNCRDLEFDLLKGYIPMKDGGNQVGFSDKNRDRTAGMRWMLKNHQKLKCDDGTRLFDIDFFAGNGVMRAIMTSQFSPYEESTHIAVTLFKGTYYIWEFRPNEEIETELNNKRSFGGLRFEDFVSRGINGEENEPSIGDQNNYADARKYYNVVRFNFDTFKMVVSGEVDCVFPGSSAANGKTPKVDDFIEIKTSAPLESRYDETRMSPNFRCGKISAWFAQCILLGVKHVVIGIRDEKDDKMTCRRTHAFTLQELRENSNGSWSQNRCFDDLKKFLCIVKEKIVEDNPEIINVFVVKNGLISEPEQKKFSDECEHLPDISEVVELMCKL